MKNTLIIAFLLLFILTNKAQELDKTKKYTPVAIGFWNCENFYDTLNDPLKNDEDFLPSGTYGWTGTKFRNKLDHISTVISQLGTDATPDGVAVIGLCEIENRSVLESIVAAPKLVSRGYKIVHVEGPDRRGVDVAFLYNPKYFKVTSFHSYRLVLPTDSTYPTRDQLLVSGKLLGEDFHFIICHWPSRGGPNSEINRMAAGKLGRKIIDSLLSVNPNAKVILMGDLNDDPTDPSVRKGLNTTGKEKDVKAPLLFNAMEADFKKGNGTLAYQDAWNLFDQQIMTPALVKNDYTSLEFYQSHRFNKPFVLTETGKYKGYPLRTHSGGQYTNGYSDHLSVYSILLRETK
ncbi:MAG: endonuclease/exonuclease/phosphatase family protein [Bacteroidia bacterium]